MNSDSLSLTQQEIEEEDSPRQRPPRKKFTYVPQFTAKDLDQTGSVDSKENREPSTQLIIPRGNGTLKQLTRGQSKKGADRYAEPNAIQDEVHDQGKGGSAFWSGSIDISKESAGEAAAPSFDKMIKRKNVSKKKQLAESQDSSSTDGIKQQKTS